MIHQRIFNIGLFLLLFSAISFAQENKPASNIPDVKFAQYLYNLELYELAAEEFEKVIYYQGDSLEHIKKLMKSYQLSGQKEKLHDRMSKFEISDKALIRDYIQALIQFQQTDIAAEVMNQKKEFIDPSIYNLLDYEISIAEGNWEKAKTQFADLSIEHKAIFSTFQSKINKPKRKSPALAGTMSAIIPSTGRFYAGDIKDGILSLFFMASPAVQSHLRFKKNGIKSVGGWLYGGIGLGFYIGNIYGSSKAAKRYNNRVNQKHYNEGIHIINTSFNN